MASPKPQYPGFLSYGIIPSVSDAGGREVTPPPSVTAAGPGCGEEAEGKSPAISDCLRSGCIKRAIKATTPTL